MAHTLVWTSPQPLWGRFTTPEPNPFRAPDQARPALLRFASDDFMQQALSILESDPRRIGDALARPETWRTPPGELPDPVEVVRRPKVVRQFLRQRAGTAATTALVPTTAETTLKVNGVQRTLPLKLYHPAHQRFYLVAANLVCRLPGFPDLKLGTAAGEKVGFLLRRLLPASSEQDAPLLEYAFVKDARGPHWERVPSDDGAADPFARSVDGEELLPLFPLNYSDDTQRPRRLFAGLIPVGRREEYMSSRRYDGNGGKGSGAGAASAAGGATGGVAASGSSSGTGGATGGVALPVAGGGLGDGSTPPATKKSARKEQLKLDVTEPWKALIRSMYKAADRIETGTPPSSPLQSKRTAARQANEGAQMQSWLILLDFADYLALHVPNVWAAVTGMTPAPTLSTAEQNLFGWISNAGTAPGSGWYLEPSAKFASSLQDALKRISAPGVRDGLEGAERTFVSSHFTDAAWPGFYYLLTGVREQWESGAYHYRPAGIQGSLDATTEPDPDPLDVEANPQATSAENDAAHVDKLVQLVLAAVDADATTPAPPVPFAVQLRDALKSTNGDPGWFVVRCVFMKQDCNRLPPPVLSAASQQFQLASFFDPDAPARPIRIALPTDTTPAGMRKHQKNTAFVFSDVLCGQVNRLKGLGFGDLVLSVLPWPFHKDLDIGADGMGPCADGPGVTLGMICSLSIPIITICALILLFMIVLVLDFIFKWIPWFIICFPLPGLKAKKAGA